MVPNSEISAIKRKKRWFDGTELGDKCHQTGETAGLMVPNSEISAIKPENRWLDGSELGDKCHQTGKLLA
ncbi:hypothetical protein [Metabacillus indicus]|uniref:Uncharacterized protein n=1 Tax=Metabacillus indicus TaxID=246786 RepID=A0A084GJE0_METID|nr:hypothetical protein [Metabacillus indicus]KEZ47452.1 hypothetical protein GS18_0221785 [Metabacillus indicus]